MRVHHRARPRRPRTMDFWPTLSAAPRLARRTRFTATKENRFATTSTPSDLVEMFVAFARNPRPGEVYNAGGGRPRSCSVLEAIALAEDLVGQRVEVHYAEANRKADHIWWITDVRKFQSHYPEWSCSYDLRKMLTEIRDALAGRTAAAVRTPLDEGIRRRTGQKRAGFNRDLSGRSPSHRSRHPSHPVPKSSWSTTEALTTPLRSCAGTWSAILTFGWWNEPRHAALAWRCGRGSPSSPGISS